MSLLCTSVCIRLKYVWYRWLQHVTTPMRWLTPHLWCLISWYIIFSWYPWILIRVNHTKSIFSIAICWCFPSQMAAPMAGDDRMDLAICRQVLGDRGSGRIYTYIIYIYDYIWIYTYIIILFIYFFFDFRVVFWVFWFSGRTTLVLAVSCELDHYQKMLKTSSILKDV